MHEEMRSGGLEFGEYYTFSVLVQVRVQVLIDVLVFFLSQHNKKARAFREVSLVMKVRTVQ